MGKLVRSVTTAPAFVFVFDSQTTKDSELKAQVRSITSEFTLPFVSCFWDEAATLRHIFLWGEAA
jgi:hypothetical protein